VWSQSYLGFEFATGWRKKCAVPSLIVPVWWRKQSGFCGIEVLTDAANPSLFLLLTRWTDEQSFRAWHRSEAHHQSHGLIPQGLKLDASFTALTVRNSIEDPTGTHSLNDALEGQTIALSRWLMESDAVFALLLAPDGTIEEALRDGHSHVNIYVDVFSESLHRVGELWGLNKISVAQEHIATSITQYAIATIYPRLVPAAVHRGNMVVTGVSGELHQIGANLVADAMEAKGWTVRFLGTNLPHASVLATVEEISADVLCISTTIVANLPSVVELVRVVRSKLSERAPKIVLGGAAYRLGTQFAREVGTTQAVTDLRRGLAMLCA
jgi:MerR family transcriptional regulator, light-induced transcriptional regulator